jgi:hypothetical protein
LTRPASRRRRIRGATASHLVEKFARRRTLRYEFTVDDPATWTKKWSASSMTRSSELMFEYACHEANYGMEGVLKGARYQDREAAKTEKEKK